MILKFQRFAERWEMKTGWKLFRFLLKVKNVPANFWKNSGLLSRLFRITWKFCQIVNLFKAVKMENGRFMKSTAVVLRNSSSILKQFNAGKTIWSHLLVTAENPVVAAITKKWRIDYVEFYSKSDIRNGLA